jgi:hypothetical protein
MTRPCLHIERQPPPPGLESTPPGPRLRWNPARAELVDEDGQTVGDERLMALLDSARVVFCW